MAGDANLSSGFHSEGVALVDIVEATLRMSKLGLLDIYEQCRVAEGVNLLVVVDQFEELFRYRSSAAPPGPGEQDRSQEAVALVNLLLEARAQATVPIYVVLTMRSDFLGDCSQFPGLAEAINEGQYLVPRMDRQERTAAIAEPAKIGAGAISPVLLTRLLNDTGDNPDQLPILQHALNRTWARWADESGREGPLLLSHYEAVGTMARALDLHADEAYAELADEQQRWICEKIFKALTDQGTDARGVRRPTGVAALCALAEASRADVTAVIDVFRQPGRSFLMPPLPEVLEPDTVIDISHESLMRVWERLKRWTAAEARSAYRFRRISETATEYEGGKAGLLRDPELQLSLDWRTAARPNAAWAAQYGGALDVATRFLTASAEEREKEQRLAEQHQRRELEQAQALSEERARSARRLRFGLVCTVILAIVAIAAAGWALRQRAAAERVSVVSLARQLAAQAVLLGTEGRADLEPAALLAVEAMRRFPGLESDRALRESAARLARQSQRLRHDGPVRVVRFSPDGRWIATGGDDKTVRVFEAASGRETWRGELGRPVNAVTFSPDGRLLLTAGAEPFARVLDVAAGKEKEMWQRLQDGAVRAAAFSADGHSVAIAGNDGFVRMLDTVSGREMWRTEHGQVSTLALSTNGRWILTVGGTRVRVVDAATHKDVWNPAQQEGIYGFGTRGVPKTVVLSPDDRFVAVGRGYEFGGGRWQVVELATGRLVSSGGYEQWPEALAFSPDSRLIAIGGADKRLHVQEVSTGKEVFQIAHGDAVTSASFSPDGQMIATGSQDHNVRIVDVAARVEVCRLTHQGAVTAVAFAGDGRHVASASEDGTARLLDLSTDLPPPRLKVRGMQWARFSADGSWLIMSGSVDPLNPSSDWTDVFDASTAKPVFGLSGEFSMVLDVRANRRRVAVNDHGVAVIELLDAPGDKKELWRRPMEVRSAALSPDGDSVAVGGKDAVTVLDVTGHPIARLPHDSAVTALAFSEDGRRLATQSLSAVRLFDAQSHKELRRFDVKGRLARISTDGGTILTTDDGAARVYEVASSREVSSLPLQSRVESLQLSGDGRWVAMTVGNSARVFEAATGREMSRVQLAGIVRAIAFSDQGRLLLVASQTVSGVEVVITRHRLTPQDMIVDACARLTRNLTKVEWTQYIGAASTYRRTCASLP